MRLLSFERFIIQSPAAHCPLAQKMEYCARDPELMNLFQVLYVFSAVSLSASLRFLLALSQTLSSF